MGNPNSEQRVDALGKQITYAIARYAFARLEVEKWNQEINKLWRQKVNNPVGYADP